MHELGHALVAFTGSSIKANIRVGGQPPLANFTIGRLSFGLHPFPGWVGFYRLDTALVTRRRRLLITLAGPLASLLAALALFALAAVSREPWQSFASAASYYAAFQLLFTAMPITYPRRTPYAGWLSDGLTVIRLLRGDSSPWKAPAETQTGARRQGESPPR